MAAGADKLWQEMSRLLDRLVTAGERASVLDETLDKLVEQFRAQRALVLQSNPSGHAAVLAARGPRRDLTESEREEISRSIIRRAVETGECVVWRSDQLDSSASMEALSITIALVAPLHSVAWRGGERTRGVLYLDFRDVLREIDDDQLEFFRAAASLVAVVLELSERLQLAHEDLRVARARDASGLPTLDELLWPPSMAPIRREIESALYGESSILLMGESGTGKTALARAIADASGRAPVVRAVLGAADDLNTITSELFGHERGAFSGAVAKRVGLVELAAGGTLILDEILNLHKHAQQLLLDFAQFGTYRPLGHEGAEPKRVKVRLLAATNGDLDAAVKDGRFRLDLYYRLAGAVLAMPPLRTRHDEVPALAEACLNRIDASREWTLALPLRRLLTSPVIEWPGNVRQLEHVVRRGRERALARNPEAIELGLEHFEPMDFGLTVMPDTGPSSTTPATGATAPAPTAQPAGNGDRQQRWSTLQQQRDDLERVERELIVETLSACNGVVSRVARELSLPRSTLVSRMRALGLESNRRG